MTKLLASVFAGFSMLWGGLFGGHHAPNPTMASTTPGHWTASTTPWNNGGMGTTTPGHMGMMGPGVMGVVVSIDGTSLTVSGHSGMDSATTTYTVDASSAKVIKSGSKVASTTIADVAVGDNVMVSGTVSGTDITAKVIVDGIMGMMRGPGVGHMHRMSSSTPQ